MSDLTSDNTTKISFQHKYKSLNHSEQIHNYLISQSPNQEELWSSYQIAPQSSANNIVLAIKINSHLDVSALQRTFQALLDRHPALRTNYSNYNDKAVQQIHPSQELCFQHLDTSSFSCDRLQEYIREESERSIDLENGSILRVSLFTNSETKHILLLVFHAIAIDFVSLTILLDEFKILYPVQKENPEGCVIPLDKQYLDYLNWRSNLLTSHQEEYQNYWQKQLQGELPLLNLPIDQGRSRHHTTLLSNNLSVEIDTETRRRGDAKTKITSQVVTSYQKSRSAIYSFKLEEKLTQQLRDLAQQEGTDLYTILLAAWQTLLYRYTGQEDILVGSSVDCRNQSEYSQLLGNFANLVVLRADLSADLTFKVFLDRTHKTVKASFDRQEYPYSLLSKYINQTQPNAFELIQASFTLHKFDGWEELASLFLPTQNNVSVNCGGLELEAFTIELSERKFDLGLEVIETSRSIQGVFNYNGDLFEPETIARIAENFQVLLQSIIVNPERTISELTLLASNERHKLLVEWTNPEINSSSDLCIHQLFEEQVAQNPDAIALHFEGQQLTYTQLNAKANQLAHYLQSLGVTPEVLVGLCVERSIETIVGILGILKAGGAYLPLDPTYPQERLQHTLSDSGVSIVVTIAKCLDNLPEHQANFICLDRDRAIIAQKSEENPHSDIEASNLAYVIYTSGSTGKPKGVLVTHDNVVRLFTATQPWYNFNSNDVWTLFHSYAFDFSVWEIWGALIYGGRLVVVPYWVSRSPEAFYELLRTEKVTVLNQTPSAFNQLIQVEENLHPSSQLSLRFVIFGGEALELQSLQPWFTRHGDKYPQLVNMYGITETTVHVTYRPLTIADLDRSASVIGCSIPDLNVYLLDQHLQAVPIGVAGEMYVAGAGVSRGYLNRPELNAERFIPNPFSSDPEARLYKSGDLARYLSNGDIEYLGRIDRQVKIRGFRIELGEIEAALTKHPQVNQTVVIAREDRSGYQSLVAYVVNASESNPSVMTLRQFLQEQLPNYMIPAAFVILESLPLTDNGKIDRKALPAPDLFNLNLNKNFVAPSTPVEEIIAAIWADLFGVERVGVEDDFFALGGHSLLATQIISRLRETFAIDLAVRNLFEAPTIAKLSQLIERDRDNNELELIPTANRNLNLELSFAQMRLWFLDRLEGGSATYNIPLVLHLQGNLDVDRLESAFNKIIKRHEILRTTFSSIDGTPIQVILPQLKITIPTIELINFPESEQSSLVQELAAEEAAHIFDLTQAPLIRAFVVRLQEQSHLLMLTMHHIITDGWSMSVLMQEWSTFYQDSSVNTLPELPIQYVDFAIWQRQWLSDNRLKTQLQYWKQQLAGIPPTLELPSDRPRPATQTFAGSSQSFQLSPELSKQLVNLSQQSGSSLYMTLLAAFATLLHRYSNQEDIVIGSPIANRNRQEIESLIGFFVNTLALRIDLEGNPTFSQLLHRVRQVALDAYTHQDLPFEKLVEELQPERHLSYHPIFQVMFVLQNTPDRDLKLPDLSIESMEMASVTSQFDLTLSMKETEAGLQGTFEYKTDLFDATTIERTIEAFQTLLTAIVDRPETAISELPILTATEKHQLLVEWNQTETEYSVDRFIQQLFEQQVAKNPDAIAIEYAGETLTYRQLNTKANQLAHYLRSLGIEADKLVGISVERSLEMVVGLLGILKAGGAYVPLDPAYPAERLAYMVADAEIPVLLTQSKWTSQLPKHQAQVICLDSDWSKIALYSQENPNRTNTGENLAYVIYTSGSTGKPKGVMISHQALANFTQTIVSEYNLTASDRVLQFASINFDIAVEEIFPSLCQGATLVLRTDEMLADSQTFFQACEDLQLTVLNLPTAYWHQLASDLANTDVTLSESLRLAIIGGEKVLSEPVKSWQEYVVRSGKSDRLQLINTYGPTETTVSATLYRIPSRPSSYNREVPIGRPLAHLQTYILDSHLQPVPIGVPGELHIGGDSLARGYLNRPELTAEKFIPNPFSQESEARLYKTGDLVRYLSGGNIEFLGRIDHQVKIRGFRIELGEIETVLAQHSSIRETVVIAREDTIGDKRLVAYVVSQPEQPHNSDLRSFLQERLPNYMVPSAFVFLDTMPLTPNGKVDRRALPTPDASSSQLNTNFVLPSNPTEEILVNIWTDVLGVEQVGIHDNFFELGGHSLLATRVISQLNKAFSVELSLRHIFEKPTVAALAIAVIQSQVEHIEDEDIAHLLAELEGLSDEEVQQLLAQEMQSSVQ